MSRKPKLTVEEQETIKYAVRALVAIEWRLHKLPKKTPYSEAAFSAGEARFWLEKMNRGSDAF
jgi:hypothetical protein